MLNIRHKSTGMFPVRNKSPQTPNPATKLRVDLAACTRRGGRMTDHELVAALCVRIGMIMEDVCGDAVTARAEDGEHLACLVARLLDAGARIGTLADAAGKLLGFGQSSAA